MCKNSGWGGYLLKSDGFYLWIHEGKKNSLVDYKFMCFNGKPEYVLVCSDRFKELKEDFFDMNWKHLNMRRPNHQNSTEEILMPDRFNLMKKIASALSKDIPFSRIDLYSIDDKIYFGEITFYPASGFESFIPSKWDIEIGSLIPVWNGTLCTK